ncbi:hypothetical protein AA11826_1429 [Komagataeibacter oboediens DSM 11826]|nr:lysozyme inhibitor LprI family protein [Komagataeibacter oboediens]GBR35694.1 hypothetical protein AA11826_1429 [Komagataeibacter oboediens DSM 11826]
MKAVTGSVFLAGVMTLPCTAPAAAARCPGMTTPEIQACQRAAGQRTEAMLDRYVMAAEQRLRQSSDPRHTLAQFRQAQDRWKQYRAMECRAMFAAWSGGTIRGSMELQCSQTLTESRIRDIWQLWLTYPDTTPPTLPRPIFPAQE